MVSEEEKRRRVGQEVRVTPVNAEEQTRRTQAAVARRAYQIFESRGSASWHELEDWREAESELVRPLSCGRMALEDSLWVGTDVALFREGTIDIWVAPRRLTICGEPRTKRKESAPTQTGPNSEGGTIFIVTDLPFEIDPLKVKATLRGRFLEVLLGKAREKRQTEMRVAAA
jgi:HSP20 family molecular chaperone IbpA